jgi:ATP-binding cassette subfamily B protein
MLGQTALTLIQPWPVQRIIDHVVSNPTHGSDLAAKYDLSHFILTTIERFLSANDFDFLFKGIGLLLIIYVSSAVLLYFQNAALAQLGQSVVLRVRERLLSHLISLPHNYFENARTGDLTSRISKDTADAQDILEGAITIFVRSLPTIVGILIVSFTLDWIYAMTFILVIPLIYWANVVFTRRTKEAVRRQRRIEGVLASNVQEAFYYHKAVTTLSLEDDLIEDFLEGGRTSALHGVRAGRFQGVLAASMDFLIGVTTLVVLFMGALRILHGCLTVGQLMVFLSYLNSLFKPIREISKFASRFAKSSAAMERVEEIMRINPMDIGATELPGAVDAPHFQGHIAFNGVSFGYRPDQQVLEELNLSISAGQKVALVGDSGSGKSSILYLLMRLYDPWYGKVEIDGADIRTLKLSSLRNQLAVVLQDSFIFNMTIRENIAIARPGATKAEVVEAAKAAEADEFIRSLPDGYDTHLGEGGAGLSGGQKRRLAIARAILRNAPIVLLDEPTVGLDAASEQKVVEALGRLTEGRTTLIVTHQLCTITNADLIVVLSKGKIVETGAHEQLLEQNGPYKTLWQAQQQDVQAPDLDDPESSIALSRACKQVISSG